MDGNVAKGWNSCLNFRHLQWIILTTLCVHILQLESRTSTAFSQLEEKGTKPRHVTLGIPHGNNVSTDSELKTIIRYLSQSNVRKGISNSRRTIKVTNRKHPGHSIQSKTKRYHLNPVGKVIQNSAIVNVFLRNGFFVFPNKARKGVLSKSNENHQLSRSIRAGRRLRRHSSDRKRRSPAWMMQSSMVLCESGVNPDCQENGSNHTYSSEE